MYGLNVLPDFLCSLLFCLRAYRIATLDDVFAVQPFSHLEASLNFLNFVPPLAVIISILKITILAPGFKISRLWASYSARALPSPWRDCVARENTENQSQPFPQFTDRPRDREAAEEALERNLLANKFIILFTLETSFSTITFVTHTFQRTRNSSEAGSLSLSRQ